MWGVLFAVLSACVLPACKTDLSDVWNSIDNIDDRLSQVEKKIEEMNTNIDALSKICDALSTNVSVSSVTPLQDASGYEIVFSDGTKATIHNGTDAELPRLASGASLGEPYVQDATYISVDGGKTRPGFPERTESPSLKVSRLMSPPPRSHWSWLTER